MANLNANMSHFDREAAKMNLYHALEKEGWTLYGYKEDHSDSMTDYFDPEYWDGIAEVDGYILVVDAKDNRHSGGKNWPEYQANPFRKNWHIEYDGKIIISGRGLWQLWLPNQHLAENQAIVDERIAKFLDKINKAIAQNQRRLEKAAIREGKTDASSSFYTPPEPEPEPEAEPKAKTIKIATEDQIKAALAKADKPAPDSREKIKTTRERCEDRLTEHTAEMLRLQEAVDQQQRKIDITKKAWELQKLLEDAEFYEKDQIKATVFGKALSDIRYLVDNM